MTVLFTEQLNQTEDSCEEKQQQQQKDFMDCADKCRSFVEAALNQPYF